MCLSSDVHAGQFAWGRYFAAVVVKVICMALRTCCMVC